LGATAEYKGDKLSTNLTYLYVGERRDITHTLPSYDLWQTGVSWTEGTTRWFAKLENILNEDYEETEGYQTAGRSAFGGVEVAL
jgi:outer membrane cobalamin receptor